MNKEFEYELDHFSKLSDLLQNDYNQREKDRFDSNHAVYHSELVFAYYLKSEMPITFRFEMKLELLKDNNKTKLIINVNTFKFYMFILAISLSLAYITFQVNSSISLNLLWILLILMLALGFRSSVKKEITVIEQKLIRQTKE